ncbi:hypothetical protein HYN59_12260 [Flavobacterium album]|uniref:T9SS type B sorting domain-containing protein n=1 Tax=Flavobacterium album TaxID=2175091 RepID=A0A2S1QZI3_9FLAO|nr:T9SS type B sorting domain-containing protein [Flavobacterium album]AWH85830.1 hypothetical protein HYN59_12260 [Flavobacterium album]
MNIYLEKYYRQLQTVPLCSYICIAILLITGQATAQDFTLNVSKTDELCPGNGSMTFSVENAAPSIPVNYKVYALPNTTTAISDNSNTSVTGLIDGTYLVVATQMVNGSPMTDQEQVTIEDHTVTLTYDVQHVNAYCGPDGSITISVTSGTAATYEILVGPVTRPPQSSNIFNNLPAGNYSVRVVDNCGSGNVITHEVFSDSAILGIGPALFPDEILPACDQITISNLVSSSNDVDMAYPLTVTVTVHPPGGGTPLVYTQSVDSGGPQETNVRQVIQFYYDTPYYYDIKVVDPCGTVYLSQNNLVDQKLAISPVFDDMGCGFKALILTPGKYIPPYNITFIQAPTGFDPVAFNAAHPGPFNDPHVTYGTLENPVPVGLYKYSITDSCGHTGTGEAEYVEPEVEPIAGVFNAGCTGGTGRVEINIPGFIIGTATVTEAPEDYEEEHGLPNDVSEFVTEDDGLKINDLPIGEYVVTLIDTCGTVWPPLHFEIKQAPGSVGTPLARPDCTPGKASLTMGSTGGTLTVVRITAAPAGFTEPLPYDVSFNISPIDYTFYMDNLPPGNYSFLVDTSCETGVTRTANLNAYSVTQNDFELIRHCGSFDLEMHHTSNAVAFLAFWLQKYNAVTGTWGHPVTGESVPTTGPYDAENALQLTNNSTVYSLTQTGQYRVMKVFQSFPSGSVETKKICDEQIYNFEFLNDLQITRIASLTCSGAIGDVQVDVEGAAPINYEIISKNGDTSFYINNGQNNIFNALDTAFYVVRVTDLCGNLKTQTFNVADLPSLVTAVQPGDLELCDEGNNGKETFDLSQQDAVILDGQDPTMVDITYHTSQADADTGQNPVAVLYESATATIYARVVYNNNTECFATTSFDIIVHSIPQLQMNSIWTACQGQSVEITADAGYTSYEWSGGQTTQSITVSETGSHTVKVTNEYGCAAEKTIQVSISPIPVIKRIDITDWTDNNNTITVVMEDETLAASFEYSVDGINFQDSNIFSGLPAGPYIVFVKDKFDCGLSTRPAFLLTYPKFFTPNGDGINETWRIKYAIMEPDMFTYIFDRYGKLITGFDNESPGWDGTLNGKPLPSTDYWFVVVRQNGEEKKGHFSMIR